MIAKAPGAVAPSLVNWDDPLLTCLSIIAGLLERPISTKALKAGDMLTYVISQGNAEYGLPAVPDFVGYVALALYQGERLFDGWFLAIVVMIALVNSRNALRYWR